MFLYVDVCACFHVHTMACMWWQKKSEESKLSPSTVGDRGINGSHWAWQQEPLSAKIYQSLIKE